MKKSIICSMVGAGCMLGAAFQSGAQGTIYFANYSFGISSLNAPVTFAASGLDGANPVTAGWGVGSDFKATLLYSLNGGSTYLSDATGSGYPVSFGYGSGANGPVDGSTGAGYFVLGNLTLPQYVSGDVTVIVQAFNGATYGQQGFWSGQSSPFVLSSSGSQVVTGLNTPNDFGSAMSGFTVSLVSVPEPSTLALAGLGGFGMLMALRRKKA